MEEPPRMEEPPLGWRTTPPGWRNPPGMENPPRMETPPLGQCAGGTHPTGMHSCCLCYDTSEEGTFARSKPNQSLWELTFRGSFSIEIFFSELSIQYLLECA